MTRKLGLSDVFNKVTYILLYSTLRPGELPEISSEGQKNGGNLSQCINKILKSGPKNGWGNLQSLPFANQNELQIAFANDYHRPRSNTPLRLRPPPHPWRNSYFDYLFNQAKCTNTLSTSNEVRAALLVTT